MPTPRSTVRRLAERAAYDRETIDAILDEGLIAHVGLSAVDGPVVIPMIYARDGDRLLLHGSAASRLLRAGKAEADLCVTVTLVDGLVLARSAFHHSINYRSVVVQGRALAVADRADKLRALELLTDHVVPGRSAGCRAPNDKELKATLVLSLPLDDASAKVRTGPPKDDEEDLALDVWAGVLPLATVPGEPVADAGLAAGTPVPLAVARWRRPVTAR
jgi:nitroimidazol reductase NimA-like FMN-containing flavoprotein (pyridoxamine 5'-phosphate oxidase superfamily)